MLTGAQWGSGPAPNGDKIQDRLTSTDRRRTPGGWSPTQVHAPVERERSYHAVHPAARESYVSGSAGVHAIRCGDHHHGNSMRDEMYLLAPAI